MQCVNTIAFITTNLNFERHYLVVVLGANYKFKVIRGLPQYVKQYSNDHKQVLFTTTIDNVYNLEHTTDRLLAVVTFYVDNKHQLLLAIQREHNRVVNYNVDDDSCRYIDFIPSTRAK